MGYLECRREHVCVECEVKKKECVMVEDTDGDWRCIGQCADKDI